MLPNSFETTVKTKYSWNLDQEPKAEARGKSEEQICKLQNLLTCKHGGESPPQKVSSTWLIILPSFLPHWTLKSTQQYPPPSYIPDLTSTSRHTSSRIGAPLILFALAIWSLFVFTRHQITPPSSNPSTPHLELPSLNEGGKFIPCSSFPQGGTFHEETFLPSVYAPLNLLTRSNDLTSWLWEKKQGRYGSAPFRAPLRICCLQDHAFLYFFRLKIV